MAQQRHERQTGRSDDRDFVKSLNAYEAQPAKEIPDKVARSPAHLLKGATQTRAASAADVAAAGPLAAEGEQSRIVDQGVVATHASADDSPVVDEDGTLGDPTDSGEGTSDEQAAPSTATDDSGVEADPNADLTGAEEEETPAPAPAKGSAQERIVELNDKLEGAMVFGKAMQDQYKAVLEENVRIRAGTSPSAAGPVAAPQVVPSDDPGPMPDMSDADVAFDNDKYRAKLQEWSSKNARREARAILREVTGAAQANSLLEKVNAKVETFAKAHEDFAEVVTNNRTLTDNQLAPDAGLAVAQSPYTAELLYKFGSDPAFAIRVAKMHPRDQLITVGEMVAEIKAEKKAGKTTTTTAPKQQLGSTPRGGAQPAARKSITNAPPPPRPTPGAGRTSLNPLDPSVSMDDFVRQHRQGKQSARESNRRARGL